MFPVAIVAPRVCVKQLGLVLEADELEDRSCNLVRSLLVVKCGVEGARLTILDARFAWAQKSWGSR